MIPKSECCEKTLEILLRNVKHLEDLTLIESTIEDLQTEFKINLVYYKHEVQRMREVYRGEKRLQYRRGIGLGGIDY